AAKAAGDFDRGVREARERAEAAERKLQERDRKDAVRDEIDRRGFTGSKARMLMQLVGPKLSETGFEPGAALDAIVADYPDAFGPRDPQPPTPPAEEPAPIRRRGPAPAQPPSGSPFEGYISPDDYQRAPQAVRLTPKFRERVEQSRPYWPDTFDARRLP